MSESVRESLSDLRRAIDLGKPIDVAVVRRTIAAAEELLDGQLDLGAKAKERLQDLLQDAEDAIADAARLLSD